jgi:hypothetical protein
MPPGGARIPFWAPRWPSEKARSNRRHLYRCKGCRSVGSVGSVSDRSDRCRNRFRNRNRSLFRLAPGPHGPLKPRRQVWSAPQQYGCTPPVSRARIPSRGTTSCAAQPLGAPTSPSALTSPPSAGQTSASPAPNPTYPTAHNHPPPARGASLFSLLATRPRRSGYHRTFISRPDFMCCAAPGSADVPVGSNFSLISRPNVRYPCAKPHLPHSPQPPTSGKRVDLA